MAIELNRSEYPQRYFLQILLWRGLGCCSRTVVVIKSTDNKCPQAIYSVLCNCIRGRSLAEPLAFLSAAKCIAGLRRANATGGKAYIYHASGGFELATDGIQGNVQSLSIDCFLPTYYL